MNDLLFYILVGVLAVIGLVAIFKRHEVESVKYRYIMIATIVLAIVALVVIHTGLFGIIF